MLGFLIVKIMILKNLYRENKKTWSPLKLTYVLCLSHHLYYGAKIFHKILFRIFYWRHQIGIREMSIRRNYYRKQWTALLFKTLDNDMCLRSKIVLLLKFQGDWSISKQIKFVFPRNKIIDIIRKLNPERIYSFFSRNFRNSQSSLIHSWVQNILTAIFQCLRTFLPKQKRSRLRFFA